MSIVTKTGDKGQTGMFGGRRVFKDDVRIHTYGSVDELNAGIGIVLADSELPVEMSKQLLHLQHILFKVGGDLATPMDMTSKQERISPKHVQELEQWINTLETELTPLTTFILPGGTKTAADLHLARTVCRRAERWSVSLSKTETINTEVVVFLNRLSDYLFLMARKANVEAGRGDVVVEYS